MVNNGRFPRRGFTLIELMLVVAVIGLLAAIALPKFGNLVNKAHEASTRGKLATLRSSITLYFVDNEGKFPSVNLVSCIVPRYIDEIPRASLPMHGHALSLPAVSNASTVLYWDWPVGNRAWAFKDGSPGVIGPGTHNAGAIYVHCTHTDSRGTTWNEY